MGMFDLTNDDFIRTTEPRHERQVQALVKRLLDTGDVYLGEFEGWYDEGQEEYVTETKAKESDLHEPDLRQAAGAGQRTQLLLQAQRLSGTS